MFVAASAIPKQLQKGERIVLNPMAVIDESEMEERTEQETVAWRSRAAGQRVACFHPHDCVSARQMLW
jgi:hypothetical protein